jgi:hypothetical protein
LALVVAGAAYATAQERTARAALATRSTRDSESKHTSSVDGGDDDGDDPTARLAQGGSPVRASMSLSRRASACLNASSIYASGCVVGAGERVCDGGDDVSAHPGYGSVRGEAGIVSAEKGKDGRVSRKELEYARCKVCHTVSFER